MPYPRFDIRTFWLPARCANQLSYQASYNFGYCACCRYVGSKSTLFELAQQFNITEYSVIRARQEVTEALLRLLPTVITWPQPQEFAEISREVSEFGQYTFPGIVGFLDGSHIPIWKPRVPNPDAYFNRKKYHSVNMQAVCREDLRFTDVSVGCPGRMHDARALRISSLWNAGYALCGQGAYHVLADAAYPLTSWMLTPYRNTGHLTPAEQHFKTAHSSKRQTIERAFGVLKKRFPLLRRCIEMVSVENIKCLIMATCVLHNLCILDKDDGHDLPDEDDYDDANPRFPQPANVVIPVNDGVQARLKRILLTNRLYARPRN